MMSVPGTISIQGFVREPLVGWPSGLHKVQNLWRGDTWFISGKLFDSFMNVQDLTAATIQWLLMDFTGNIIRNYSIGNGITIVGSPVGGQISIAISDSPKIPHARYWNKLIVTIAGVVQTYWVGGVRIHDFPLLIDDLNLAGLTKPSDDS